MNKRIVFTGGHHNSALLIARALKEKGYNVWWFGHKFSMLGDKNPSAEYLEVTAEKIPFIEIKAGKWQPRHSFWRHFFRIPLGFCQSFIWLLKLRPKIIYSSGGYLAFPVAAAGFLLSIPVVVHEQTTVAGTANKIIALLSKKVFISFLSSEKYYPRKKVVYTGLPIRQSLFKKSSHLFKNNQKTIYITGGKQGSHIINQAVFAILPLLLEKFNVIHQCGSSSLFDDFGKAESLKKDLLKNKENYLINKYFFENEIGNIYGNADFVISRAGAHTVYELLVLQKPAILIPIPWSENNEQEENAKMLESSGLAMILKQTDIEEGKLMKNILKFGENLENYKLKGNVIQLKINAVDEIVEEVEKLV